MQYAKQWDHQLFLFINGHHWIWLDYVMRFVSSNLTWFVVLTIGTLVVIFKKKWNLVAVLAVGLLAVGITDALSTYCLKGFFERLRPCFIYPHRLHLPLPACGSWHGFPSNHAGNTAAFVAVIFPFLGSVPQALLIGLAFLIGYSRVYLGVHYPLDVLAGFSLGTAIGFSLRRIILPKVSSRLSKNASSTKDAAL